jgi:hypothetical protein
MGKRIFIHRLFSYELESNPMRKGEKGFTYPLTLMMLLLFLLVFSVKIEWLMAERKMAHEQSIIMQEEYYYLSTVKKVVHLYQSGTAIPVKSTIIYTKGTMEYQSEIPNGSTQKINFILRLNTGETVGARGFFDTSSKKLTKWIELK